MTYDGTHTYTYDAENRLTQVDGGSTASYLYDAEGHRVTKTTSTGWRNYLYDISGKVVAETIPAGWNVGYGYLGGQQVAQYRNSTTYFVHHDHLGSTRLVSIYPAPSNPTSPSQWLSENLDYLPFGELNSADSGIDTHKFTGKERDSESGLDNFGARYYTSNFGRFMSPDWSDDADPIPYADADNPQTFNRYAYVSDNPINATDDNGHDPEEANPAGTCGFLCKVLNWIFGSYASDNTEITGTGTRNVVNAPIPGTNLTNGDLIRGTNEYYRSAAQTLQMMNRILDPTGLYANATGCTSCMQSCGDLGFGLALAAIPGLTELKLLPAIPQAEKNAIAGVLKQIATGTTKGKPYFNLTTDLPVKAAGYYREYTVPLPGVLGKGEARIITGAGGEIYYTAHHFAWLSFIRLK